MVQKTHPIWRDSWAKNGASSRTKYGTKRGRTSAREMVLVLDGRRGKYGSRPTPSTHAIFGADAFFNWIPRGRPCWSKVHARQMGKSVSSKRHHLSREGDHLWYRNCANSRNQKWTHWRCQTWSKNGTLFGEIASPILGHIVVQELGQVACQVRLRFGHYDIAQDALSRWHFIIRCCGNDL